MEILHVPQGKASFTRLEAKKMQLSNIMSVKRAVPAACVVGMFWIGSQSASAAVSLPMAGGAGTPTGDSAGFATDSSNGNELFVTQVTSPVAYSNISSGGQVFDLRFNIVTTIYTDKKTGTEDFVYQLYNDSSNDQSTTFGDTIERLTLQSFAGYSVTGDYIPSTGSSPAGGNGGKDAPPLELDRSGSSGAVVGFDFSDANNASVLIPGAYSDYLVVRTNATTYTNGTASVIGSLGQITNVTVPYGYAVSIPEPTSLALLALSGAGLLGRRRRAC